MLVVVVCALAPNVLRAQAPLRSYAAVQFETGSAEKMVAYGLLTGAAGLLLGGLVGAALSGDTDDSDSWVKGLQGAVIGATIGESLMLPVGVHIGNGRQGELLWSMPASLAIGVAGAAISREFESRGKAWPFMILTPIAQLAASMAIERHTSN